ncbi:hypothetical protein [Aeromonas hydrophila]|uniref:hypothetical protein n=1 Tax=Aeromonas hydrophila TaxID=644 RepID=UPI0009BFB1FA|nr:hypothetical protein [Aeromonas hydrophila]EJN6955331.1 hypothetical protein [Aeromonas hydrophila]MCX4039464.1 hypothetical protein [Aeromonas hydrophila]TNI63772.1 hypothetical protein CF124_18855 [Aeromonas hydrophila]CAD7526466.1 hypothetical protein KBAH04_15260 [Aeromonas hydrophila]HAU4875570.1 hypothetical protein [Aeromonas hydrophila]
MGKPFQRIGSKSNSQAGRDFELAVKKFFSSMGIQLERNVSIEVGINGESKYHSFDLGCLKLKILVECKSHKWTSGDNVPSAKLTVWNEAMYYFLASPNDFRKIFVVLRDVSSKRGETLADYYIKTYYHLIPRNVEFWEYNENTCEAIHIPILQVYKCNT